MRGPRRRFIEGAKPQGEVECALVIQMACTHGAAMAVLRRISGAYGFERNVAVMASAASRLLRAYTTQFAIAYAHFTSNPMTFGFPSWGELVRTNALPWHYIPGQFLARLPEGFLLLLGIGLLAALATAALFGTRFFEGFEFSL
jgi:hypothetical protein